MSDLSKISKEEVEKALGEVSVTALEDWAMMLVESADDISDIFNAKDNEVYIARMIFKGPIEGTIEAVCSKDFAIMLCKNLLGLEEEAQPSEEECLDSLREMTNVLTGNFVTAAFGSDLVFDLILPEAERLSTKELESRIDVSDFTSFSADDCKVGFRVGI